MNGLIVFLAKYLIVAVMVLWLTTWVLLSKPNRIKFILATLAAGIMAIILSKIAGAVYFHPRLFTVENIKPLVPHGPDNGFPSEHTVLAMTLSTLIYFYRRRLAAAALVCTLLIGAGR